MAKLARVQVPPEMRRLAWLDEAPAQDSALAPERELELALALRIAALLGRPRRDQKLPALELARRGSRFELHIDPDWLERNPLTEAVLADEVREWKALDVEFRIARSTGRARAAAS